MLDYRYEYTERDRRRRRKKKVMCDQGAHASTQTYTHAYTNTHTHIRTRTHTHSKIEKRGGGEGGGGTYSLRKSKFTETIYCKNLFTSKPKINVNLASLIKTEYISLKKIIVFNFLSFSFFFSLLCVEVVVVLVLVFDSVTDDVLGLVSAESPSVQGYSHLFTASATCDGCFALTSRSAWSLHTTEHALHRSPSVFEEADDHCCITVSKSVMKSCCVVNEDHGWQTENSPFLCM